MTSGTPVLRACQTKHFSSVEDCQTLIKDRKLEIVKSASFIGKPTFMELPLVWV